MKIPILNFFAVVLLLVSLTSAVAQPDTDEIRAIIKDWDDAWEVKDVDLAIKHYAEETDWTNAFGDRVTSKAELKQLLTMVFGLDFVMAGENNYGEADINFLSEDVAIARSLNVRLNQQWPDGSPMSDRKIAHLRVLKKENGTWYIVSHMISQAHDKQAPE